MALAIFGTGTRLGQDCQPPLVRRFNGFAAPRSSVYLAFREISLSGGVRLASAPPVKRPAPQLLPKFPYHRGFSYHPTQIFGILTLFKYRNYGTRLRFIEEAQPSLRCAKPYFGNILGKAPFDTVYIEISPGGINR